MKEAIILAGGLGTRLQSVVNNKPKCMASVANEPFLKYIMDYLTKERFEHVILALGYKAEYVLEWVSDKKFLFELSYVIESKPLGTGGAIKNASRKMKSNTCFIFNGDTYFNIDTAGLMKFHIDKKADISIALRLMENFDRYGSVDIDDNFRIYGFNEKKYQKKGFINGGIYIINKEVLNNSFPESFSFEKDILESGLEHFNIAGFIQDGYFIDIGIPSDYEKANIDFLN